MRSPVFAGRGQAVRPTPRSGELRPAACVHARVQVLQLYRANKKRFWRAVVALVLIGGAFAALSWWIDVDAVRDYAESMNGWLVFVLISTLPLVGFPVTVLHVAAGVRWGAGLGLALVAASILLQLLASHALVKLFHPLFEKRLAKLRKKVPKGAHRPVTLFTILVPGVPYFAKNYLIPLVGVPLPTFLLIAFPIHAVRAVIAVVFGEQSDQLTAGRIACFAVYWIIVTLGCAWAFRRLRKQIGDQPPAEDGPTQSA